MTVPVSVRVRRVCGVSVVLLFTLASGLVRVHAQAPSALFSDERVIPGVAAAPAAGSNPLVRRSRTTTVNFEMLTAPGPSGTGWAAAAAPAPARSVALNLFSDVNLIGLLDRVETVAAANGSAWVGTVSGVEGSQVILSVADGVLDASISTPGHLYAVRRAPDGTYVITDVDPRAIQPDGEPLRPESRPSAGNQLTTAAADSGDTFDLLLYYTTAAKNAAGGTSAIKALITATIAQVNAVYLASGIGARVRLVGGLELNYTETGSMNLDLPALRDNATVAADRNRLGADIVSLLVSQSNKGSGLGYVMDSTSVDQTFAPSAFNVTLYYSFIGYIGSLAHEMGHNMGCLHEPGNNGDDTGGAFLYSLGYTDPVHKFYDVMSYGLSCTASDCQQMNQFSSATNTYQGYPSGTATQDNVRTINNTRAVVANFRQSVASPLGAPSNLTASSSGSNITLSWTAGIGTATGYQIDAGSSSGKANLASFNTGSKATTFTASGIANGLYYVRVMATDGSTTSAAADEAVLQVGSCSSAPATPVGLNINVTRGTFVLAWLPSARATGYLLDAGSSSGASNLASGYDVTSWVVSVPGGNAQGGYRDQVSFSYSGLGAGSYYLRVRAKNSCGTSSASSDVVAVVK